MRLFVAIDISEETRTQLRHVREALESQLAGARKPPRVTWVRDEAAHVTLRFIGEVADDVAERVREALGQPFEQPAFDIEWKGVGTFGGRRPRVVWIGAAAGGDEASALADAVNQRLETIAGPGDDRPFRPHLTIGRVKEPGAGFDWPKAVAAIDAGRTRSRIDRVVLYQSRTSPKGPAYTALTTTALLS